MPASPRRCRVEKSCHEPMSPGAAAFAERSSAVSAPGRRVVVAGAAVGR